MIFSFENNSRYYKLHELMEFDLDNYVIEDTPYSRSKVVNIFPGEKSLINIVKRNKGRDGKIAVRKSQYRVDRI